MNDTPLCMLMILDGWGINPVEANNAVALSGTPFLNRLIETYPHTRLQTSGRAVGLPAGIMGNSEVGHLNIGAGRIVFQDLLRIDRAIEDKSFFSNPVLSTVMDKVAANGAALHLMGLVSDGGVHSQLTHLLALLDMAREKGLTRVYVHAILDGRDTPPKSGAGYLEQLQQHMDKNRFGAIATVCGRFYAMDRDKRWERVEKAFRLYAYGEGRLAADPVGAVQEAYARDETDEFVTPVAISGQNGKATATIGNDDGVIFFNFRADRAREITRAFTDPEFAEFDRTPLPRLCDWACMTLYDASFDLPLAFGPEHMEKILGQVVSEKGFNQLRIAETEKYAHVTYFFNGGEETPFPGEDRCLVPSPRDVPTYDHKPAMSATAVADEVLARIDTDRYRLIVLNFANMDMVGHTGKLEAAIEACRTVDRYAERIVTRIVEKGGAVLVTADHGNAEKMRDENGNPHTAHTTNPVRLILADDTRKAVQLREGILADIAPTILDILNIDQPPEMTGKSLIILD
jgi:2,3-bisphosphoglycerate-independent phosphoglycerate mutase